MDSHTFAWLGAPIDARPLFAPEHAALMGTLRALTPADWEREAVPGWTVRDVAAHVLGDCYGRLGSRDAHRAGPAFAPGETLEAFVHRINRAWVDAFARVSPPALTDTLDLIGGQTARFLASVDPRATAVGVSWAGVDPAPMWLDAARELTEYWTHRQQIRHAVGQGTDTDPRCLAVVLDTFMRALPHTLREVAAPAGTQVRMRIDGPAGGVWTATATGERWSLAEPDGGTPEAGVDLDVETAWRLCTRAVQPEAALVRARVDGDRALAEAACRIVSIVY
ncbi:maleylpyruvate isomerase family mycothiol-dependent enzyme [Glycomyces sp. TRM65418]|uniref:maleylpyruvate isomerase family mycothiol-dependent enzyme n=1 Tax=Glycomyces sp. TRM65418 TaxID=2867006 RepID=UPI001CE4F2A6|nr:maleylpyruvate isomerase family mycothiol-dependent enzyme [Glycomyces sp. TRM65418]MCC3763432.1 maleylpyruvate isomerase family mycothiol-dependent enzyme [Glycomyces sp. TRM65418]QZD57422.1 maleylpyruvate isomerase family mycothiol-dependent enzyme [Glycomyces sp. TRM65418]